MADTLPCRGDLDCYIYGYGVTLEDDGNGNFALYISDTGCKKPEMCQAKRVLYYALHSYLAANDFDGASTYVDCCCATGGEGHTYQKHMMRLVQPVEGMTPPAEPIEGYVELPYNCDEPVFAPTPE